MLISLKRFLRRRMMLLMIFLTQEVNEERKPFQELDLSIPLMIILIYCLTVELKMLVMYFLWYGGETEKSQNSFKE
ncbi:MAG: hydrogenase-4 membrane subunit HyfE [Psychroserpens sp.]|jgi:hydrogenase-4 membrane subunit HyfE